jgi:tetratricopeptide (TPR) repeat protein
MTMNKIRWSLCIAMVTVASFFTFARYVVEAWHFGPLGSYSPAVKPFLLSCLGCFLLWRQQALLSALSKNAILGRWRECGIDFDCSSSLLRFSQALVSFVLALFTCAAGYSAIWNGGLLVAESFNSINAYEIGERIFKYIPDPWSIKKDRTLATNWYIRDHEEDTIWDEPRLDQIVSQVYGASSLQVGERYFAAGENNRLLSMRRFFNRDEVQAKAAAAAAMLYYEKALRVYRSHSSYFACARLTTMIALCELTNETHFAHNDEPPKRAKPKVSPDHLLAAKARLAEAVAYLPFCLDRSSLETMYSRPELVCGIPARFEFIDLYPVQSTIGYLSIVASMADDKELTVKLNNFEALLRESTKEPPFEIEQALCEVLPLLTYAGCLMLLEQILLGGITIGLNKRLTSCANKHDSLEALNMRVSFALFRGNFVEAERYSARLLKLAESL